ncbi:hypothetical protein B1207_02585 [Legionella quinlivanii]|uniref:Uncharacterized protein n=1 Tax=Legionella quinlivanii TaxID=45073 RepID=A0A364LM66_9GAMM|nr:hypothetical protein [Legionella quinlivanii]RAP37894.1 hypothetical protein B1207_02585 [Legionella quinlivanii]
MNEITQNFINQSKDTLQKIINTYKEALQPLSLHEKVLFAYAQRCFEILTDIGQTREPVEAIEKALRKNWKFIKNSMLCYTALPTHKITEVWCQAAKLVAIHKPQNPLLYLMPDLQCAISNHNDYPDLIANTDLKTDDLTHIFSTHILNNAGTHLLPVKVLLLLNESIGIPRLDNPYFDDDTDPQSIRISDNEIYRLTHYSLDTKELFEAKLHFDALSLNHANLLGQLGILRQKMLENSRHGVGEERTAGHFFDKNIFDFLAWYEEIEDHSKVPKQVQVFINKIRGFTAPNIQPYSKSLLEKGLKSFEQLPAGDKESIEAFITPLKKLADDDQQFKQAQEAVQQALTQYDQLKDHLESPDEIRPFMDKIRELIGPSQPPYSKQVLNKILNAFNQLPFTERETLVKSITVLKGLIPTEEQLEEARQIIYQALKNLGIISIKEQQPPAASIPTTLKPHLEKLKRFAFKKNNQENPATCLISLGNELDMLLKNHGAVLAEVALGDKKQSAISEEAIKRFHTIKESFRQKLANKEPLHGYDRLGINRIIKDGLKLEVTFNHSDDFGILEALDEKELEELCSDPSIAANLLSINNSTPLIYFALTTSPGKLNATLGGLSRMLMNGSVKRLHHLVPLLTHLLHTLDNERCVALCNHLRDYLIKLCISSPKKFENALLFVLEQNKRSLLINTLFETIIQSISSAESFCQIYSFRCFAYSGRKDKLFDAMKDKLPALTSKIKDRTRVYNALSPEHRKIVFPNGLVDDTVKIKNLDDFISIYSSRHTLNRTGIFESNKEKLKTWVTSSRHLLKLFNTLSEVLFKELLESLGNKKLQKNLTPAEIPEISMHEDNLSFPLHCNHTCLLSSLVNTKAIKSYYHFTQIAEPFSRKQLYILNQAGNRLNPPLSVKDIADVDSRIESSLSPEESLALADARKWVKFFFNLIEKDLSRLDCNSTQMLSGMLQALAAPERKILFTNVIKPKLHFWLKSFSTDAGIIIPYLAESERQYVLEQILSKSQLSSLFQRASDYIYGPFKYLDTKQRLRVFRETKAAMLKCINSFYYMRDLFEVVAQTDEERIELFEIFKSRFSKMGSKTADRLSALFRSLPAEQRDEAFKLLKRFVPKVTTSTYDLVCIAESLTTKEMDSIRSKISIIEGNYFCQRTVKLMSEMDTETRKRTIEKIREFLPEQINSVDDFITISSFLTPRQCHKLFVDIFSTIASELIPPESVRLLNSLSWTQFFPIFNEIMEREQNFPAAQYVFCSLLETNGSADEFKAICNNKSYPLSHWIKSFNDLLFFLGKRSTINIILLLEEIKPLMPTLNLSTADLFVLENYLTQQEYAALTGGFISLPTQAKSPREEKTLTASPGRSSQSFFGSHKRKATDGAPTGSKRACTEAATQGSSASSDRFDLMDALFKINEDPDTTVTQDDLSFMDEEDLPQIWSWH